MKSYQIGYEINTAAVIVQSQTGWIAFTYRNRAERLGCYHETADYWGLSIIRNIRKGLFHVLL